ncbi:MAG: hypothetical protein AAGF12_26805 [Myxococcota bacterium]
MGQAAGGPANPRHGCFRDERRGGHTDGCVVHRDGHITCWGSNRGGEVGDNVPLEFTTAYLVPLPS